MIKKLILFWLLSFMIVVNVQLLAQDYQITFAILGESEKPDSVEVENLVQSEKITLKGDDVLHLVSSMTGINSTHNEAKTLKVYPNPMFENVTLEFYNPRAGNGTVQVYNMDGKCILNQTNRLPKGTSEYMLSGLTMGTYIVNINTKLNKASAVIISKITTSKEPAIALQSIRVKNALPQSTQLKSSSTAFETIQMLYNDGETLKFTAYLDFSNSNLELVATENEEISFELIIVDFSADKEVVAIDSVVSFSDNSTNGPSSWYWDFGDGSISVAQSPTHMYKAAGKYTVSLNATNISGNGAKTKTNYIDVGAIPTAIFTTVKSDFYVDSLVTFINNSTGDITGWLWDFGDGTTSEEENPEHSYDTAGSYKVTLAASNTYGSSVEEKTCNVNVIADFDGNTYKTVWIGDQLWMAENLKVTHEADGTPIPLITENSVWANQVNSKATKAYCYYNNDAGGEASLYGGLYTYGAALDACPTGWHLPSDDEWKELEMYIGMSQEDANNELNWRGTDEGLKLKSKYAWNGDGNGTDEYGFTALPGGNRDYVNGAFYHLGNQGYWWTSREYWYGTAGLCCGALRQLALDKSTIKHSAGYRIFGLSVRCVRDD